MRAVYTARGAVRTRFEMKGEVVYVPEPATIIIVVDNKRYADVREALNGKYEIQRCHSLDDAIKFIESLPEPSLGEPKPKLGVIIDYEAVLSAMVGEDTTATATDRVLRIAQRSRVIGIPNLFKEYLLTRGCHDVCDPQSLATAVLMQLERT